MGDLVGHRVTLHGLASRPELNGICGLAESYDEDKCRVVVHLEGGVWGKRADGSWAQSAGGGKLSLKPDNLAKDTSLVGSRVKIDRLEGRTDLNGTFGWARSFDVGKGRYQVELQGSGGAMIALKPDSLTRAEGLSKTDWMRALGDE
eukprot:scaffold69213_cov32-Tisochrysis_lutea.AAC.2